jgi:hypothetical protein
MLINASMMLQPDIAAPGVSILAATSAVAGPLEDGGFFPCFLEHHFPLPMCQASWRFSK